MTKLLKLFNYIGLFNSNLVTKIKMENKYIKAKWKYE